LPTTKVFSAAWAIGLTEATSISSAAEFFKFALNAYAHVRVGVRRFP
jgi:hypothetical protein